MMSTNTSGAASLTIGLKEEKPNVELAASFCNLKFILTLKKVHKRYCVGATSQSSFAKKLLSFLPFFSLSLYIRFTCFERQ